MFHHWLIALVDSCYRSQMTSRWRITGIVSSFTPFFFSMIFCLLSYFILLQSLQGAVVFSDFLYLLTLVGSYSAFYLDRTNIDSYSWMVESIEYILVRNIVRINLSHPIYITEILWWTFQHWLSPTKNGICSRRDSKAWTESNTPFAQPPKQLASSIHTAQPPTTARCRFVC